MLDKKIKNHFSHVDLRSIVNSMISTTDLSRNLSKTIKDIKKNNKAKVVIKNNQPQAVLMSIKEYNELMTLRESMKDDSTFEGTLFGETSLTKDEMDILLPHDMK